MKKVGGRFALLGVVVILSIAFFLPSYPSLFHALPDWLKKVLPSKGITLGLDLQGGIHLVMEVEEDRAVEIAVDRSVNSIQDFLVDKQITVRLAGSEEAKRAKELIQETALLEFEMLDEESKLAKELPAPIQKEKEEEILKQFQERLPEGDQILFEKEVEKDTGREYRI